MFVAAGVLQWFDNKAMLANVSQLHNSCISL